MGKDWLPLLGMRAANKGVYLQSRERSRKNYDRLSRYYDILTGASEHHLRRQGLAALSARPGEIILEVGCGTGLALRELAGRAGKVIGVDLSPRMAEIAGRRVKAFPNALVGAADSACLPFPPACFDAAWMAFTLELFDDAESLAILAEVRRTLKPAARLGVITLQSSRKPAHDPAWLPDPDTGPVSGPVSGWMERIYLAAQRRFPDWIDCRPIDLPVVLGMAGFRVELTQAYTLWGLPVCIAVGRG
jgi:demethylmenaquinone methyltransferase/2-methoxy-6-polyprenyl-1,4-benzoquinol methylase